MMYRLRAEGDYCRKGKCAVGSPKCDKCPCNFGLRIKNLYRKDRKGGMDRRYVKCASWMGFGLSKCVKDFMGN